MMITKNRGLYIHVPICVRKCAYCDFVSFAENGFAKRELYFEKLISEIRSYKEEKISVDTVFFGGGTPSLMSEEEVVNLMSSIRESFCLTPDAEISIEINPKTLTRKSAKLYKELGINRVSLGVQSIHEKELKKLGRIHSREDFLESYAILKDAGFENISLDLMYGIPEQSLKSFEETLSLAISLCPEQSSVYGLILEEGTPLFDKQKEFTFPSEDEEADMYYLAANMLAKAGYRHYEISNYAKEGKECKHNLKYWRAEEYVGVGVAAHSFYKNRRFFNPSELSLYLSLERNILNEEEITVSDAAYERVMLALRLLEGLSLTEYRSDFSVDFREGREAIIERFIKEGYAKLEDDRLALTEKGFYISNYIISELI